MKYVLWGILTAAFLAILTSCGDEGYGIFPYTEFSGDNVPGNVNTPGNTPDDESEGPCPIPIEDEDEDSAEGLACLEAGKVWLCHQPAEQAPHNICVGEAAASAHAEHGDYEGDCVR